MQFQKFNSTTTITLNFLIRQSKNKINVPSPLERTVERESGREGAAFWRRERVNEIPIAEKKRLCCIYFLDLFFRWSLIDYLIIRRSKKMKTFLE